MTQGCRLSPISDRILTNDAINDDYANRGL